MGFNQKKEYALLKQRINKYAMTISQRYSKAVNDLLSLQKTYHLGEGEVFSFDDNPKVAKQAQKIIKTLNATTLTAIQKGIKLEWAAGNAAADAFVASKFGKKALKDPMFASWMRRNTDAMQAFISRSTNGLKLSDRVWKTGEQLRKEVELALSVSIGEGKSASEISREVRQYLKEPDRLFRRVRDAEGNLKLSRAAAAYHSGQGVYRSSYKNAMRLARTETNMAYRKSDNERWQQMEFVTGIRIELSHNHPKEDMCDDLAGDYPKDFDFTGWHPNCFCHAVPLTISDDDFVKMQQAMLNGEEYDVSSQMITEMPDGFKEYAEERKAQFIAAHESGTLPYFAKDNWAKFEDVYNPITQSEGYKLGQSVLGEMKDIPDLDTSGLKHALAQKDLALIDEETKKLQAVKDELSNLVHIENGLQEAKTYGYKEVLKAESVVTQKINYWKNTEHLSLAEQAKSLDYHANKFLEGNMVHPKTGLHAHDQYPSWKIQQKAFNNELAKVQEEIKWADIKTTLQWGKSASSVHVSYDKLTHELEQAISKKDFAAATKLKAEIELGASVEQDIKKYKALAMKTDGAVKDKYAALLDAASEGRFLAAESHAKELAAWEDVILQKEAVTGLISADGPTAMKKLKAEMEAAIHAGNIKEAKVIASELEYWKPLLEALEEIMAFKSKSKEYNALVAEFKEAVDLGLMSASEAKLKAVQAKRADLYKKYGSKKADKVFKERYEQTRKDKAVWDKEGGDLADKTLFDAASEAWLAATKRDERVLELISQLERGKLTEKEFQKTLKAEGLNAYRYKDGSRVRYYTEREAMYDYTQHYCDVNEPLQGRRYSNSQTEEKFKAKVNAMTDFLDTTATPADMWFQRGDNDMSAVFGRLNFAGNDLSDELQALVSAGRSGRVSDETIDKLQELVGLTMEEGGFMSMGSAKHKGFDETWDKHVIINIFAPKGTKAMYAENFSAFGNGSGSGWNGKSRTSSFSKEFETIAQRGTRMRITKIEKGRYGSNDIIYIDVEIVGQNVRDLSYVKKENIGYSY